MTKEAVEKHLKEYRVNSARCDFLRQDIPRLEKLVQELRDDIVDNEVHITQVITDMPRGGTTSDPTGKLGMKLANGYEPRYIEEIETEIKQKQLELKYKDVSVWSVETGLKSLTPKERFLIEHKYIQEDFWRNIVEGFNKEFGEGYNNKDTLKKMIDKGLDTMAKVLA